MAQAPMKHVVGMEATAFLGLHGKNAAKVNCYTKQSVVIFLIEHIFRIIIIIGNLLVRMFLRIVYNQ